MLVMATGNPVNSLECLITEHHSPNQPLICKLHGLTVGVSCRAELWRGRVCLAAADLLQNQQGLINVDRMM